MTEEYILYKFFGMWQIVICAFAFVALLAIHRHILKNQQAARQDKGLLWLSIAVLVWCFTGGVDVLNANALQKDAIVQEATFQGLRSILSIVNSAFILLALPQFKHIPPAVRSIIQSDGWRLTVGISFALSVVMTLLMLFNVVIPSQPNFIFFIDLIYALFTLSFLGIILWSSFAKRGLMTLAWLSAANIIITLVAQFLKLDDGLFWSIFFNCIFKTILIVLFFALAFSWVEELSKKAIPSLNDVHLVLLKKRTRTGKYQHYAIFNILPLIHMHQILLSESMFNLLAFFAKRRKDDPSSDGGWLEIQPKSASNSHNYDIKDHKQIGRLIDRIFEGLQVESVPPTQFSKQELKQILFDQNRQRKIRLRILPKNIELEK